MTQMETPVELEKVITGTDNEYPTIKLARPTIDSQEWDTEERMEMDGKDAENADMTSFRRFQLKLKTNKLFREKVIYAICLFVSKFILGWGKGTFGPSYIDIRMISGTSLDLGSWILTSNLTGFALGSILQGVLYGRFNSKLMFGITICLYSTAFALVPWCRQFESMVFAYAVIGIMQGILASGTSADIIRLWGKESRVIFLGSQVMLALGSSVAPLVVSPFLTELPLQAMVIWNTSSSTQPLAASNVTIGYALTSDTQTSNIYIPFTITSFISFLSAFFFFVIYLIYDRKQTRRSMTKADDLQNPRKVPKAVKLFILSMFGSILFILNGVDESFTGFLATYCVQFFNWSKKDGALITFVYFVLVFSSRIFGVVVEKWMNTIIYTVVNFVILCISVLGMLLISLYNFDTLVWFFSPVFGFAKSCLFPLIFCWTNDYITPLTGRISSFYYTVMMVGGALNPVLLGNVMEHVGLVWFCFVLLIESFLILIFVSIVVMATRYIVRCYGRPSYKTAEKQAENLNNSSSDVV